MSEYDQTYSDQSGDQSYSEQGYDQSSEQGYDQGYSEQGSGEDKEIEIDWSQLPATARAMESNGDADTLVASLGIDLNEGGEGGEYA